MNSTLKQKASTPFNPFAGPTLERVIPITASQSEIWTACKFGGEAANKAYNDSISLFLKGNLHRNFLEDGIKEIIERHESLRATFSANGLFMNVFEENPIKIHYQDITAFNIEDQHKAIEKYLSEDASFVFDLVKGPLLRVGLIKINDFEHHLVITAHHIICDGWSTGIILEELGTLYSSYVNNKIAILPKQESFSDYADDQQEFIHSATYKEIENFWLRQYADSIPQVTLPTDFPRPELRTFKSNRKDFYLDSELLASLKKVGVQSGCSLVTTLISVFEVFLYQQTGQNDLVLGLPSSNQSFTGKNQLIGHCVNLLPLRTRLSTKTTFTDYLRQRKSYLFDAYEHQSLSFGQLLQKLPIPRDASRVPLVPIMFNFDTEMTSQVAFADLTYELKTNPREFEAFELFLNAGGTEDNLLFEWSYNSSLFKQSTITQMMNSFVEILKRVVDNPNSSIGNLVRANDTLYQKLNATQTSYSPSPLSELILRQAQKTPKRLAVEYGEKQIFYDDFQDQVNALTHQLIEQGVCPGDFVGVSLYRSEKLPILLLAILQSGAAYLPLDPNFPSKRLGYMLEDSNARFLVTTKEILTKVKGSSKTILLEDLFSSVKKYPTTAPNIKIANTSLAYLLYTSGSTGQPKGVPITHKNLVNFLSGMALEPGIKETDRLLSITTISFDIAGLELFLPLLTGATLVLTDDETTKDPRMLMEVLRDKNITMLQATPTTWQMLLDSGWEDPLPIKALSGGEALPLSLAKKIAERTTELWNMYGPTETTIWSSVQKISVHDESITIGHPIANTQLYVLNENGFPVNPGIIGEIAIGGDGVANGYWKREALTAEKFLFNPVLNKTLYSTGDLGKLLPNGEIQCLGRKDQQVKIRGHRIELEEIEEALGTIAEIHNAVVAVKNNTLIAHVVLNRNEVAQQYNYNDWEKELAERLPDYMVPRQFNILSEFPTTLNGKIDRNTLSINFRPQEKNTHTISITTKNEEIVADVWKECLKLSSVNRNDNFFELGGHSMVAIKVMTLLEKKTDKRLPLSSLLQYPTIKQLASLLDKENPSSNWKSLVPMKPEGHKPPLFIVHGANYNVLVFEKLAQCLDEDQPVYGLQAKGIDGTDEPDDTVETMAANFIAEMKTVYPEGPYSIAGFSFGGIIAFEMYKQLKAEEIKVKILALFDSYVYPNYYYSNISKKKRLYKYYQLRQLVFVSLNMFSSKKNFNRRVNLLKLALNGLYLRFKYGQEKQVKMQFNRSSLIDKFHSDAFLRYTIEPQDIKVDLFRASENVYFAHDFKFLGWTGLATKGIRKHKIPGNHNDMFLPPNVEKFAEILQHTLDNHDSE
ncbi:amino acid adenylation domain-containing protein [Flagellimonas sp. HMM57]|uniref:non-ribosomal peptide synthetase n=1 Tax=unclassified Flagellimonas TaxID=2644544 RepID=UPI0013CFC0CB|nr:MULTISPECIES: non-ribosomal peptide synthetase [unclassified Flagellimonas]UII76109.1 amino acid adenylation domain-containing protein [Flagellimonas sp. HMM57]